MKGDAGDQKRERVLAAAKEVFAEKGYHRATVSDVVKKAHIARSTFYLYFDNKRHLFDYILDALLEELGRRIQRITLEPGAPSPLEQLRDNLLRVIFFQQEKELRQILLNYAPGLGSYFDQKLSLFYEAVAERIESSLKLGIQMGLVRPCNTRLIAYAVIGAVKEVMGRLSVLGQVSTDPQKLVNELLDFGLLGILTEETVVPAEPHRVRKRLGRIEEPIIRGDGR